MNWYIYEAIYFNEDKEDNETLYGITRAADLSQAVTNVIDDYGDISSVKVEELETLYGGKCLELSKAAVEAFATAVRDYDN